MFMYDFWQNIMEMHAIPYTVDSIWTIEHLKLTESFSKNMKCVEIDKSLWNSFNINVHKEQAILFKIMIDSSNKHSLKKGAHFRNYCHGKKYLKFLNS